jgi:hypothetical protein
MALIYTNQTSKKKKKLTNKQRELQDSWNKLLSKYEPKKKIVIVKQELRDTYSLKIPRETPNYPSLNSGHHDTAKKAIPVYTGTNMIGIGTLHKSNAVPVFSSEEASEMARMRRG